MSEYEWTPEQCDLILAADARMRQQDERIAELEAALASWSEYDKHVNNCEDCEWGEMPCEEGLRLYTAYTHLARAALAPKE